MDRVNAQRTFAAYYGIHFQQASARPHRGADCRELHLYLFLQQSLGPNHVLEDGFAHVTVHRRQGVVEKIDVAVAVHRARQTHSLFLSAAQIGSLL